VKSFGTQPPPRQFHAAVVYGKKERERMKEKKQKEIEKKKCLKYKLFVYIFVCL